jgi:hypothetical protein
MEQLTLAAYAAFHVNVEYLEQKGLTPMVEAEGRNTNAVGMVPTIENFLKENPAFQALNDDQRNGLANGLSKTNTHVRLVSGSNVRSRCA